MTEWKNTFFNITNEISVPILISIIVFIVGGLMNYSLTNLKEFVKRKRTRKTFYLLIREVIKDLITKEKNTAKFYPKLRLDHEESWVLTYTSVSYLNTFFELDFNEIYNSFGKKFFWNFCSKKQNKSFHRVWAILRNLKFFEERFQKDIDEMNIKMSLYHKEYSEKLEKYRSYHDNLTQQINDINPEQIKTLEYTYLKAQDNIWVKWQKLDEKKELLQTLHIIN